MTDPAEFRGIPAGRRGGRAGAAIVAVLVVAVIGIALAKPWDRGATASSSAPVTPTALTVAPPASAGSPSPGPPSVAVTGFTLAAPPPPGARWTTITWRHLDPGDPRATVLQVVRWSGGYVALGADDDRLPSTPIWTSADGRRWEPLPSITASTFRPGTRVLAVAALHAGLLAVTSMPADGSCAGDPLCALAAAGFGVWASSDGRAWNLREVTGLATPTAPTGPILLASGPGGVVLTWSEIAGDGTERTRLARSLDGISWTMVPAGSLPVGFELTDLRGTATSYLAAGRILAGEASSGRVLWSSDGATWLEGPSPQAASGIRLVDTGPVTTVTSLAVGADGAVAIGQFLGTPGRTFWWQSSDGRRWRTIAGYAPLGPTTCLGEGCGGQPDGDLAGDGSRMLAFRGGPDPGAWTSVDGLTWRRVDMAGDVPPIEIGGAVVLLPGGVLLEDTDDTWYGEATAAP